MSVQKSEADRFLTPDELARFFARARVGHRRYRPGNTYEVFVLMVNLGLRVGEILPLRVRDLSPRCRSLKVRTLKRRSEVIHTLEIPKALEPMLKALRRRREPFGEHAFLFASPCLHTFDQPLSARAVQLAFRVFAKEAGLPEGATPHSLRHTRAMNVYRASGGDLSLVAHDLRHGSRRSAEFYVGVDSQAYKDACRRVPVFT